MLDYEKEITCIYGEGASGKTTFAKIAAIKFAENGKVIFIDTENGFNLERFKQLGGEEYLENIFILKPKNLQEQELQIKNLSKIKNLKLIIIDTIGHFYRIEDKKSANISMHIQFNILSEISKKIPVILINQIYSFNDKDKMVGGDMFKNWSKKIIKLEKDPRKIILEKPNFKQINFEIVNEGIKLKIP